MADLEDIAEPDTRTLADVSALADGTLDPARAASVQHLIDGSPALRRRYERERRVVTATQALRQDRAPARLRMSLAAHRRPAPRRRPRLVYAGGLALVAAAAVAAFILLPGGAPGAPSVSQAAALALRGPAMKAPAPDPTRPEVKLRQDVEDVYFPNWGRSFGWRAVGQRVDRLGQQRAVTVYYQRGAQRIAYTILAAPALKWPGKDTRRLNGVAIQSFTSRGRLIVTWRHTGHTCILSGARVSVAELAKLAAWKIPA